MKKSVYYIDSSCFTLTDSGQDECVNVEFIADPAPHSFVMLALFLLVFAPLVTESCQTDNVQLVYEWIHVGKVELELPMCYCFKTFYEESTLQPTIATPSSPFHLTT